MLMKESTIVIVTCQDQLRRKTIRKDKAGDGVITSLSAASSDLVQSICSVTQQLKKAANDPRGGRAYEVPDRGILEAAAGAWFWYLVMRVSSHLGRGR